jgi:hypothetical protein
MKNKKKFLIKFSQNKKNYIVKGFITKTTRSYIEVEYKEKPSFNPFISDPNIIFVPDLKTKTIKIYKKNINYLNKEDNNLKFIV